MDPSQLYTKIGFSQVNLMEKSPQFSQDLLPKPYTFPADLPLKVDLKIIELEKPLGKPKRDPLFYDPNDVEEQLNITNLNRLKDKYSLYSGTAFNAAVRSSNPFEYIGNSIFLNRAAVKMANIDALYHLTGPFGGIIDPKINDAENSFYFADLAGGPGGFTQYLQYKRPRAQGLGITLTSQTKTQHFDWKTHQLDMTRFFTEEGPARNGDLYISWPAFIVTSREKYPFGADLVVSDGAVDYEFDQEDGEMFHYQGFMSSRLFLIELVVAVSILKEGGNFVMKIFTSHDKIVADLLLITSMFFQEISIFKPVSSRIANAERYVIAKGRKITERSNRLLTFLKEKALKTWTSTVYVDSIIKNLPDDFISWLKVNNNVSLDREYKATNIILGVLEGVPQFDTTRYDHDKFLTIWGIPSTPWDLKERNIEKVKELLKKAKKPAYKGVGILNFDLTEMILRIFIILNSKNISPDPYIYTFIKTKSFDGLSDIGYKSEKDLDPLPKSQASIVEYDRITEITTHNGVTTSIISTQIDHLRDNYGLGDEQIYRLIDMYYPFGFISIHPDLKRGRVDGFSNPFVNAGSRYCSIFPSPGSMGDFFETFPQGATSWIIWMPMSPEIFKQMNDKLKEGIPSEKDITIYIPNWTQFDVIQTLDNITKSHGGKKEVIKNMKLYDYKTGKDSHLDIEHVCYNFQT